MLEFNDSVTNEYVRTMFFTIIFNNNFSEFFRKTLLPVVVPFAHIMFPIIALCPAFMSEMHFYGKRICSANGQRFSTDRTKIFVVFCGIPYFDSFP